jgi:hypothetical protein
MSRNRSPLSPEAQELLLLIRSGRLFAIQERIRVGKSLRFEELDPHRSVLSESVRTGFHSLVETVLKADLVL